ncbi:MAG: leucine-rich repeat domain-containing protein, partial [Prevotella sp.]|nr:leucine-rich repeat domain-containing protein [Prevotella sp.]
SIGRGAFRTCKRLNNLTIGNSVKTIGESAFGGCSFPSVIIGDNIKSIGEAAFAGNESLNSVTIGNGLTTISDYTFYNCPNIASVTIGDGVTSIGRGAFYGCKSLASMIIGDNITSIGENTFSGCKGLTTLTIGSSVNYIGLHAFELCDALTTIISKMVEPCDLYNEFSPNVYSNATLYVPRGSLEAYLFKNYWNKFRNIKEGDPNDPNGIANVESLPVLVPGEGGTLQVSGVRQGSPIYVYDISGRLVSYAQASSNVTTMETTLKRGDVGIVKIGGKTMKVVMR